MLSPADDDPDERERAAYDCGRDKQLHGASFRGRMATVTKESSAIAFLESGKLEAVGNIVLVGTMVSMLCPSEKTTKKAFSI